MLRNEVFWSVENLMEKKIKMLARILLDVVDWVGTMEDQILDIASEVDFEYESDLSAELWEKMKVQLKKMV